MRELGMEISHIDSGFMGINSRKIWAMLCRTSIYELIIPVR